MDLTRLLHPRTVAVVGATERREAYGSETLINLRRMGFQGEVWAVNPGRESVHGVPCFPTLSDLPAAPDAVVVAVPAPKVPAVIDEAGGVGAGGAVVFAAGFAEGMSSASRGGSSAAGGPPAPGIAAGASLEADLRAAALRHSLPVCGPNCDGLISLHARAALWGDALAPMEPGHVGLVSQSGNLVVNALGTRRGLRLHTAVSSGNQTVVSTAGWLAHLATEPELRSVALMIEDAGDGAELCEALAACADAGIGVAILKIGASEVGAAAAAAHTGALAGDHRVFRALAREAGAAWAEDVHDLLELAKALAVRGARPRGRGLGILTCSGGDSGLGADEAERLGLELPAFAPATETALAERLPAAATIANPLDYTALIWGDREWQRDIVGLVGEDPNIDQVLVFYDHPPGLQGASAESWQAVEDGILDGAAASPVPVLVAATLPELLDDAAAWRFAEAGVAAVGGLRTGLACAAALQTPPPDSARLREMAAAAREAAPEAAGANGTAAAPGRPQRIPSARPLARRASRPRRCFGPLRFRRRGPRRRRRGRRRRRAHRARRARGGQAEQPRGPAQGRGRGARPRPRRGARRPRRLALVQRGRRRARGADGRSRRRADRVRPPRRRRARARHRPRRLARRGARRRGRRPAARHARARRAGAPQLKGAALLAQADLPAAARLAAGLTHLPGLELVECNPVLVHNEGAVVVDAVAKEISP